jgi:opacity protein-like surface antigen
MAVEGAVWYSPSSLEGHFDEVGSTPIQRSPVHIVAGSVRVRAGVTPVPGTWAYVLAGPAVVALSGQSDVGGVIGVGAKVRVTAAMALRVEGEKYLYPYAQQTQPFAPEQRQRDLFLSLGLSVATRIGHSPAP